MSATSLPDPFGLPAYQDNVLYLAMGPRTIPWEFEGWEIESLSWKQSCYIHTGLSGWRTDIEGPDAAAFLASLCTNSFRSFPIGTMKHAVMCNEQGLVAQHAILQRNGENLYRTFASGYPWFQYQITKTNLRVTATPVLDYLFQVAGPTSLAALEAATGESLRDIGFLRFRNATIAGRTVEIGRIGMAGTLAFEVRGPMDDGPGVYEAILAAGRDHGIQRLGWRTYFVNHVEGGFPQAGWTFFTAGIMDPGFREFMGRPVPRLTGSADPADLRARFRSPLEIGWERAVRFDHDFIGREALEREAASPRRKTVTLRWNAEDVLDIHGSFLKAGEPYKMLDMPTTPSWQHGFFAHADDVESDGRIVGVSAGTIYSLYFREVLSMATINIDQAIHGKELVVRWGDHGGRIKDVRATVGQFPYLTEGRNDRLDTATLASA